MEEIGFYVIAFSLGGALGWFQGIRRGYALGWINRSIPSPRAVEIANYEVERRAYMEKNGMYIQAPFWRRWFHTAEKVVQEFDFEYIEDEEE